MTEIPNDYLPSEEGTTEPKVQSSSPKKRGVRKTTKAEPSAPKAKKAKAETDEKPSSPKSAKSPRTRKAKLQTQTAEPIEQPTSLAKEQSPEDSTSKPVAQPAPIAESPQAKELPHLAEPQSPQGPSHQTTISDSHASRETNDSYSRRGRYGRRSRGYGGDRRRRHFGRSDSSEYAPVRTGESNEGLSTGETTPQEPYVPSYAEGIVEVSGKGFGFLRESQRNFTQSNNDVFVTPEVIRKYNLRDGLLIKGETRRGNRGLQLFRLTEIEGIPADDFPRLAVFEELTTINPIERIKLETVPDRYTTRVIDLMTPIGKGQRGLIVAPPRTGKTTLLHQIAEAVVKNHPEMKLIILLVDERPEEVTEMRRNLPSAELMASSNDSDIKSHTRISQLAIERAKRLVEYGKDVFVLMDSLTRIGRAFNNVQGGGGRTMSGGVDARALEIPRRLFAAARNTEEAGSLTIVATALIETGSRMDELIFQEFKGTGNMELVLDRKISDQRIYPAADIFLSGTRREELLIPADELHKINVIRRGLAGHKPIEAIERLLFFMRKYPTNSEMLRNIPG